MIKKIQSREVSFIEFDDEEMEEIGLKKGDKFSVTHEDGNIILKKYETIELDLEEWSKDQLIACLKAMNEKDMTFEEFIESALEQVVNKYEGLIPEDFPDEVGFDDHDPYREAYRHWEDKGDGEALAYIEGAGLKLTHGIIYIPKKNIEDNMLAAAIDYMCCEWDWTTEWAEDQLDFEGLV